jgi:uncharacterized protein YdaU (DUF1376 family)
LSKRAFLPLYIGDYLADTGHLTTSQHGAYLLLLMHYWRVGDLPDDDKQLAAITKLPLRIWLDCRETIQAFFFDGWRHKRVEDELGKMIRSADRRAAAGHKGGLRSAMNRMILEDGKRRSSNATAMLKQEGASPGLKHSHSDSSNSSSSFVAGEKGQPMKGTKTKISPELEAILAKAKT